MDIISMAQQAKPKPSGQMELLRAQFTALSRVVKMMPSSFMRSPKSPGLVRVTCLPSDVRMVSVRAIFAQGTVGDKLESKQVSGFGDVKISIRSRKQKQSACGGDRRRRS